MLWERADVTKQSGFLPCLGEGFASPVWDRVSDLVRPVPINEGLADLPGLSVLEAWRASGHRPNPRAVG